MKKKVVYFIVVNVLIVAVSSCAMPTEVKADIERAKSGRAERIVMETQSRYRKLVIYVTSNP